MIEIVDVPEREPKTPELVEDVQAVLDSGKAGAFTVDADDVPATLRKVHAAAAHIGHSARKREQTENEDGTVTVTFTVGKRVVRKRKNSTDEESGE